MSAKVVMLYLVIGLAIGAGGAYFIMNENLQQITDSYEFQLEKLQDTLDLEKSQYDKEITSLENTVDEIQNTITNLQNQNSQYRNQIDNLNDEIDSLTNEITDLTTGAQYLEDEVYNILKEIMLNVESGRGEKLQEENLTL